MLVAVAFGRDNFIKFINGYWNIHKKKDNKKRAVSKDTARLSSTKSLINLVFLAA